MANMKYGLESSAVALVLARMQCACPLAATVINVYFQDDENKM